LTHFIYCEAQEEHDLDWTFPDTPQGLDAAIKRGAKVLWLNTILFIGHPVEQLKSTASPSLLFVGQLPQMVHNHDDKWLTNEKLRQHGLLLPTARLITIDPAVAAADPSGKALLLSSVSSASLQVLGLEFPVIVKPIRGRGSEGVYKVDTLADLVAKSTELLEARDTQLDGSFTTKVK